VQALAKFRMQTAEIHAVYDQYAIREMGIEEEGEWESLRKTSTRYRGLENLGNTCYINSFMQALYMTKKFRMLVHAFTQDGALPSSKSKVYALQFLFEELTRKEFEFL
jgi:ubiquitin C-terminal hydrolase